MYLPVLKALLLDPVDVPLNFIYLFIYLFFCLLSFVVVVAISWAAPAAYGGSQSRG